MKTVVSLLTILAFPLFTEAMNSDLRDTQESQFLLKELNSRQGKLIGRHQRAVGALAQKMDKQLSRIAGDREADFWFLDQMSVQRGDHRHCLFGAVLPTDGSLITGVFDFCNGDVFQDYLDLMAMQVPESKTTQYLIMDNAAWHRVRDLNWHHFKPLHLYTGHQLDNAMQPIWAELEGYVLRNITGEEPDSVQAEIVEALEVFVK